MSNVNSGDRTELLREFVNTPDQFRRLSAAILICVKESFEEDRKRSSIILLKQQAPTQDEIKRRTDLVYTWFFRLRGDFRYGFERAVDTLPRALRHEIDRDDWTPPPADKSWGVRV